MIRTADELVRSMRILMQNWQLSARPGNDGSPGNTLEDLLGIPENNIRLPDFGEIEIKTQKYEGAGALLTLFHKELNPRSSVPKILKCLGWPCKSEENNYPGNEMSFRSTTYGHRFSDRGLTLNVSDEKIFLIYDPSKVNREHKDRTGNFATYGDWADDVETRKPNYKDVFPIYYDLADIIDNFKKKLNHTMLAFYTSKVEKSQKYFNYKEAYLMKDLLEDQIVPLINEGSLVIDFDARTHHNHGTKLRIKKSEASRLFSDFRLLE